MPTNPPLRIGLIGFGMIGKVHAYSWRSLPFYFPSLPQGQITHVVTSSQETADRARALLGARCASTDYRSITENSDIDIVHICTPNHLHAPALLSAMSHQKAIYCDKPLTATLEESLRIEAALSEYHNTSQMTFQTRFIGAVCRAKELCERGKIGRNLSFRFQYLHSGSVSPEVPMKWRFALKSGGGVIADLASHILDLAEYLLGPIVSLTASSTISWPTRFDANHRTITIDTEDHLCAILRLSDGGIGTLEASKIATGMEDDLRFEIHGTHGALRFSLMAPHFVEYFDQSQTESSYGGNRGWLRIASGRRYADPAVSFPGTKSAVGWLEGHILCLGNFVHSYINKERGNPDLTQGIRVMRLMEALRQSATSGHWLQVAKEVEN